MSVVESPPSNFNSLISAIDIPWSVKSDKGISTLDHEPAFAGTLTDFSPVVALIKNTFGESPFVQISTCIVVIPEILISEPITIP